MSLISRAKPVAAVLAVAAVAAGVALLGALLVTSALEAQRVSIVGSTLNGSPFIGNDIRNFF